MIVMKFGGTSVGSAERIEALVERVRERLRRKPAVVVSALSGVTDQLIRGAKEALEGKSESFKAIRSRHEEVSASFFKKEGVPESLREKIASILQELATLHTGIHALGELTPRSLDAVAGMGERLSFEIVAEALACRGIPAEPIDARRVIVTDEGFGRARPELAPTTARVERLILSVLEDGRVPVLPGFIGATEKGISTTLGRGGSDWSASLIGAALPADAIEIWTDVDGIMTVDPRVVPEARSIPEVSFEEAAELAYFGAKVLHPATIKPAIEKGIPVFILNSLNPLFPGTRISARPKELKGEPRAIAFKKDLTVVLIAQPRMLMAYGFVARVFEVFDRHRTAVDLIATSEVSVSLTVDDVERLPSIRTDLESLGDVKVFPGMAIVSVIGRGFMRRAGLAARIFQALKEINVVMISFGASDVNISLVVASSDAERAVRLLHEEFFGVSGFRP
jgi:aspartate kinase